MPVQKGHGAGLDAAKEAISHNEIRTASKVRHKFFELGKIITIISIPHDDVATMRLCDALDDGRTIATGRDGDDPGARGPGDCLRAVAAAVVRYQDLTQN